MNALIKHYPRDDDVEEKREQKPVRVLSWKERVLLLDTLWQTSREWHELYRGKWDIPEHNNILEARSVLSAARHLSRSTANWGRKHFIFTDSLVALGSLAKGRSSAIKLLHGAGHASG